MNDADPPPELADADLEGVIGGMGASTKLQARILTNGGRVFPLIGRVGPVGFARDAFWDRPVRVAK